MYFTIVLFLTALSVNEKYCLAVTYVRNGVIGNDLSISNELNKNLAVGWLGEIRYVSDKGTFLEKNLESESEKRTGGASGGTGAQPG